MVRRHGAAGAAGRVLRRVVLRIVLLTGAWWVLTGGTAGSWLLGVPTIAGATLVSIALLPAGGWRLSPGGLARFVPFFLWQSLAGGWDVARRALSPSLPIGPDLVEYSLRLPESPARAFMAGVTSLLPGTLVVGLEGERMEIHALTDDPGAMENLRNLEARVADLFGLQLGDSPGDGRNLP